MAPPNTPVRQLIEACSREDSGDAWEELVRRFGDVIRNAVYRATETTAVARSHDLRQELVQEVYCRLLENRRRYLRRFRGTSEGEARMFFVRIAQSVVRNHGRKLRAARRRRPYDDQRLAAACARDPEGGLSPETKVLRAESWRRFWRRAERKLRHHPLGRRDLSIFRLFTLEGWTSDEISRRFRGALRPTSVLSVIYRVRRRLELPA